MFHTIIVEDDPMVANINSQYLQANPQFILDGSFANGQEALEFLETHPVDLAIVDYFMPMMDGLEFVRACRIKGYTVFLIMITAVNTPKEITDILSYGALDYIVKPFTFERFQQALEKFCQVYSVHSQQKKLNQEDIDKIFNHQMLSRKTDSVVKGIQPQTLEILRNYLSGHRQEYLTSDDIAKTIGLSRITVRRYLNYMLENHEILSQMDYTTGGRPSIRYRLTDG